jgi:hypothetical protein
MYNYCDVNYQCKNNDGRWSCNCEQSPSPTPTPSIDPCANGACNNNPGGSGDGKSDNLGCGSHDCSNHPSTTQAVLGASTGPTQAVLGLSSTGGENELLKLAQVLGTFVFSGLGLAFFKKSA